MNEFSHAEQTNVVIVVCNWAACCLIGSGIIIAIASLFN